MPEPARISIEQRLEWSDTDASGHHHHSAILRMAAVAEAELLESLGLLGALHGSLPRVHLTVDLRAPVRFRARLDVDLAVAEVGRTSIAFSFKVTADGATVADGRVVAVRVGRGGHPAPWTPRERRLLLESGDVSAAGPA